MKEEKYYVAGRIMIPIYYPVTSENKEEALKQAEEELNSKTISVINGDIHTWDGKELPLAARRCIVEFYEALTKEEAV